MAQTEPQFLLGARLLHWLVYMMMGLTTLVVTINSYDSGIAKAPLFVLSVSALLAAVLGQGLWRQQLTFRKSPADIPVVLFLLLIIISFATTKYAWSARQSFPVWVSFIICFFGGSQLFATQQNVDKLLRVTTVITSVVCIVGLIQFFFPEQLSLEFFIGKDRRVGSTLTNALYLSGYIVLLFPVLLAFTVSGEKSVKERLLLGLLLSCLTFLLVVTGTRSGLIAFLVTIPMFVFLSKRIERRALLVATGGVVIAVVAAVYLSPGLTQRIESAFSNDPTSTLARRMYFWEAGLQATKAAPIFGHGIGSYETAMLDFRSPDYWIAKSEDMVPHAHNEFVETAVDLGGSGVLVYVAIIGTVVAIGLRTRQKDTPQERVLSIGFACSIIAVLIDNISNMSLRVVPVGAYAWLFMGILASRASRKDAPVEYNFRVPKVVALAPVVLWLVFAVLYGKQQITLYQADGHVIRAIVADQAKNSSMTISEYQRAVELNSHILIARSNLSVSLLKAGRVEEALNAATQLRMLSPHYPKSNLVEAAALAYLRRYKEALQRIDVELTLRSHPDGYYYQWIAFNGLGNTVGEISALDQLLQASIKGRILYQPGSVSARITSLVLSNEEVERFKTLYEQLHSLFPQDQTVGAMVSTLASRLEIQHSK